MSLFAWQRDFLGQNFGANTDSSGWTKTVSHPTYKAKFKLTFVLSNYIQFYLLPDWDEKHLLLWTLQAYWFLLSLDPYACLQAGQFSFKLIMWGFINGNQQYPIHAAKILYSDSPTRLD